MKKIIILICAIGLLIIGNTTEQPKNNEIINDSSTNVLIPIEENYPNESIKDYVGEDDSNYLYETNVKEYESDTIEKNDFSQIVAREIEKIPTYSSKPYIIVNNNIPFFYESDLVTYSYEEYSELDSLGRCGTVIANVGKDIMPTEERGNIGMIKPSGWHTVKYQGIDGNYLYNRCHLLGYQLTAENANVKNLITGTRYMNVQGMLPFENQVAEYVKSTNNHVLLRVTPIFEGDNLLASGVLMEAKSVEDNGAGVLFNVYCYNVQPGITIDYATGESDGPEFTGSTVSNTTTNSTNTNTTSISNTQQENQDTTTVPVTPVQKENTENKKEVTYILNQNPSSMKIHYPSCPSVEQMKEENKVYFTGTLSEAKAKGYSSCGRCKP